METLPSPPQARKKGIYFTRFSGFFDLPVLSVEPLESSGNSWESGWILGSDSRCTWFCLKQGGGNLTISLADFIFYKQ